MAALTGFIGFVVTVRNSISTILDDVDAIKTDVQSLVPTAIRLTIILQRVQIWRKLWKVHDGMPLELFVSYWGSDGQEYILLLLRQLLTNSEALYIGFDSKYNKKGGRNRADELVQQPALTLYDEKNEIANLERFHRIHNDNMIRKTKNALFTRPLFEKHLKALEQSLKLLQESSETYFIYYAGDSKEDGWEELRNRFSSNMILTHVANCSSAVSKILQEMVEDIGDYALDLYLNHRTEPARRMEILEEAVRKNALRYEFSVSCWQKPGEAYADFSCEVAPIEVETQLSTEQTYENFSTVADKLIDRENSGTSTSFRLHKHNYDSSFIVQKLSDSISKKTGSDIQCLRSFMAAHKTDFERTLHGPFKKEERHRLAYELAEWALFFLKTNWFTELCSCCVYRLETNDLRTTFRTRVANVEHKCTDTGDIANLRQWCQEELTNMHILRLGILLVEIALGSPVLDALFNPKSKEVEIDDEFLGNDSTHITVLHRKDINRRVLEVMGQDFMDAVNYCLQKSMVPREIGKEELHDFYKHVVEP